MLEQAIQTKIIKKLEQDGFYVVKLIKTSKNGLMDLMALKNGKTMFIEVKQDKGILSEIQKFRIKELTSLGFECKVWTDYKVDYLFNQTSK
jgi:Holliday junction resolvase